MTDAERAARLAELEGVWRARFIAQPKLPTSALLTGACAMASGFGAVFFAIGAVLSKYARAWLTLAIVFGALTLIAGVLNRWLAARWYRRVVIPWGDERKALKAQIDALRGTG